MDVKQHAIVFMQCCVNSVTRDLLKDGNEGITKLRILRKAESQREIRAHNHSRSHW